MDERAVGVELLRRVTAVVGELLDEVLVAVAELVLGHGSEAQRVPREVLDEVLQRLVGQLRLVRPRGVAEDAGQALRVGRLDGAKRVQQRPANVAGGAADVGPVRAVGDREAVVGRGAGVGLRRRSRRGRPDTPRPTRRRAV